MKILPSVYFYKRFAALAFTLRSMIYLQLIFVYGEKMKVLITQSCLTLCDPKDCSPPGSSAHRILQERILEWVATSYSRESFQRRDWTQTYCTAGGFFTIWATGVYAERQGSKLFPSPLLKRFSLLMSLSFTCGLP